MSIISINNRLRSVDRLFLISVALPTLLATLYFGFFSSDVYISESKFIVRSPERPQLSGVGLLLKGSGFTNAGDEVFAAQNFLNSRDALKVLNQNNGFKAAYSSENISIFDRFNPTGLSGSFERLYSYYQGKVRTEHDTASSVTTLDVRAFTPEDAKRFNEQLLTIAELTVNRLNDRAREDLIRTSSNEVQAAKLKAQQAALSLSEFRNREGVVDPERQATVQLQMISKLQDELISSRTQLAQIRAVAPRNPQIVVLDAQVRSLSDAINSELGKVAGDRKSLSSTAAQYQRLQLESQFADRQLASAMSSLQDAENEARRKKAYVERIVQPNLPDYPLEPMRLRGILSTVVFSLIAWGVLSMMLAGVREHGQ